jgi:restriction endonuclease S subunit
VDTLKNFVIFIRIVEHLLLNKYMKPISLRNFVSLQSGIYAVKEPLANTLYLQVSDFGSNGTFKRLAVPVLRLDSKFEKHLLRDGDVLFAAKGNNNFSVVYYASFGPAIASSSFIVIRIHSSFKSKVTPAFIAWSLTTPLIQEKLKRNAVGTSIPSISSQQLYDLQITIPTMEKQKLIISIHELHLREKELLQRLAELKASFIQKQLLNSTK